MERGKSTPASSRAPSAGAALPYLRAAITVAVATAAAATARATLHVPDVEMLFLFAVVLVGLRASRGATVLASVLSVAAYDFLFVPPPMTFDVEDARYVLTFAMMLGLGAVVSTLAARVRRQERAAREREQRTEALYAVSRRLGAALTTADVGEVCVAAASEVIGAPAVFLLPAAGDELARAAAAPADAALAPEELEVARWALLHGSPAGPGTGTHGDAAVLCIPLRPVVEVLAVVAVRAGRVAPREDALAFAEALCRQAALALERVRLGNEARRAALRADAETLRSTLLSSVSHDLRTPLAAITGAATTLRSDEEVDPRTRRELLDAICDEAERLERLVRNLLDMTRLQSGAVQPRREWVPVEELVSGALERVERALGDRAVSTSFPRATASLLWVDPVLVQQLLVHLLENAAKYTPPGSPIDVAATEEDDAVVIEVADRGRGIPPGAEETIFERFRRAGPEGTGAGLGLAIARAIAIAHGGSLTASNRAGGGATFRLRLPAEAAPPVPAEAAS